MSLTFKLLSLAIRTAAKPIGNYIKRQAKEHDGFRRFAIAQAQRVHQIDMRMRLGILHDPIAQDRMHERELKAAEEKKRKAETPTVRSEADQKKWEEEQAKAEKDDDKKKEDKHRPKIRPLSDAKAIELGANFFSEAFIFMVAAGLIVWDSWRSRRKESSRRDMVAERLESLESEVTRLLGKYEPGAPALLDRPKPKVETAWWNPAGWWTRTETDTAQGDETHIPGNVPGSNAAKVVTSSSAAAAPATDRPQSAAESSKKDKELVKKDEPAAVKQG